MLNDLETMEVLEEARLALVRMGEESGVAAVEHAPELVDQWLDDLVDPEDLAEIREEEPEWLAAQIGLVVQQAEMDAAEALELAAAEEAELYGEEPE